MTADSSTDTGEGSGARREDRRLAAQGSAFEVVAPYEMAGDQPAAVASLVEGLSGGERCVTLRGITGSGKSATVAWTVAQLGRPTLIIAPNKSLAAQLAAEFRELLPNNRVEYFVSYYDSYTPEAYVASSDTFIDKQASVNAEIDRLRHAATSGLLARRDMVVVASVSCIYGLGAPEAYGAHTVTVEVGGEHPPGELAAALVAMGYTRNDVALTRGTFRVRGDTVEIHQSGEENVWRISLFGDEVEAIESIDPLTGSMLGRQEALSIWPASHYVADTDTITAALGRIATELDDRLAELRRDGKLLEAQRLEQRTRYDMEMLAEVGSCAGVENYAAPMEGRPRGSAPSTLLDYFDEDLLVVIDESHVAIPQIAGAQHGDASRKRSLIDHGFRLPSAADNRPLTFEEFLDRAPQLLCVSATPGPFELEHSDRLVDLVVRPTGLLDPTVEICPSAGQVDDLRARIGKVVERGERVLVTTVTKRSAEDLVDYLTEHGVRCRFMHSDVELLDRVELIRDLRLGHYDVLVGVNLLREGLDLPEVSLVAVLGADTAGFLRSETALIQTMGRAARNSNGHVVLYADQVTPAMRFAIDVTAARRVVQEEHNERTGLVPTTVTTAVRDLLASSGIERTPRGAKVALESAAEDLSALEAEELSELADRVEADMTAAAERLDFEAAMVLRDRLAVIEAHLAGGTAKS